ncbi:LytR/AlgR family response regulator transcription factor [Chitinophaga vietnamensis]|uniref:LytR/AlgR family response regulator transcription factor n=1 Tax=Chitinophaga vietnamensis TaxID=2593957 RepID=UPI0011783788|nr:response regulator [Chitinophaga vietnamensis]
MQYRCAIIDDEPLALDILESYIQRTSHLELIAKTNQFDTIVRLVNEKRVDLVLIDLNMRGIRLDSLRHLLGKECRFILVTAYPRDVVEDMGGYNGHGYIAKPASYKRFIREIERLTTN